MELFNSLFIKALILIKLFLLQQVFGQIVIDNEIIDGPQIQCKNRSIVFNIQTKNPFRGNIYVKGQFGIGQCRKEFYLNNYATATFEIAHGDCGMLKVRQLQPAGLGYTLEVMTSFHPRFVTKVDRGFNVHCFYAQAPRPVEAELQVAPLPSFQLDESTMMWPSCHYTIRSETVEGPIARTVEVGDLIIHRWQCDNPNFGMLVKNCVVSDGGSSTELVLDERGCPTKTSVIQGNIKYDTSLTMAFAHVNAFSFPDRSLLNFRCQIQVCNKEENECLGVTPPNCPTISPQDYLPNSVINPNVDPTEIIGTYNPPFASPSFQAPTDSLPFLSTIQQNPLQFPSSVAPFLNRNEFLFDSASPNFNEPRPYLRTASTSRRNMPNNNNKNQTNNAPSLQVLNRTLKQSITNPIDLFKKISVDSSILTAHQKERLSNIPSSSSSWRSKRAEAETLDVVADPVKIVEFAADSDSEGENTAPRHSQVRNLTSIKIETEYCVNRTGLIVLILLLITLSFISVIFAIYIFKDFILKRNKCQKGVFSLTRNNFVAFEDCTTPTTYDLQRAQNNSQNFSVLRLNNTNLQN